MLLALNVGNTRVSLGLFEGAVLLERWAMPLTCLLEVPIEQASNELRTRLGAQLESIKQVAVCSVVPAFALRLMDLQPLLGLPVPRIISHTSTGLALRYNPPESVGLDRLVNLVAAKAEVQCPLAVVDAGTAITIDLLDAAEEFVGGAILPGARLMLQALKLGTAQLPDIEPAAPSEPVGDSTRACLQAGLYYGLAGAVDRLLEEYELRLGSPLVVLLTGGDAELIVAKSRSLDAQLIRPDLTLQGIRLLEERLA
jgi:type III pantothenate kinase